MEKIIEIPEGYEARIEGNKVVIELKESEDERIRKRLVEYFNGFYDRFSSKNNVNVHWEGLEVKSVIAYLEKQKIPEGSPSPDLTTMLVPNRYNEQKPAENPKSYDSMDNLLADALIEMVKESDLIDRDKKNRLVWIERHRTKPAEWSEDDKAMLLATIEYIQTYPAHLQSIVRWLKSLPERFNLRPEQEWSDSTAKEMFIKALERAVEQTKKGYELTDCDKHSWWEDFKAYSGIKPAEWSEEDRTMRKKILKYLVTRCSVNEYEEVEEWLNNIRPQPHWKPSEEQMKALNALNCHGDLSYVGQQEHLISLYNDIKKL